MSTYRMLGILLDSFYTYNIIILQCRGGKWEDVLSRFCILILTCFSNDILDITE